MTRKRVVSNVQLGRCNEFLSALHLEWVQRFLQLASQLELKKVPGRRTHLHSSVFQVQ